MMTIYKFLITPTDMTFELPAGAEILTVQMQSGSPYIWVLLDTDVPGIDRHFFVYRTGKDLGRERNDLAYIGTFQIPEDQSVFHLFEVKEKG